MSTDNLTDVESQQMLAFMGAYRCLWDVSDKDYKNAAKNTLLWKQLSSLLNGRPVEDLKKKWQEFVDSKKQGINVLRLIVKPPASSEDESTLTFVEEDDGSDLEEIPVNISYAGQRIESCESKTVRIPNLKKKRHLTAEFENKEEEELLGTISENQKDISKKPQSTFLTWMETEYLLFPKEKQMKCQKDMISTITKYKFDDTE